MNHPFHPHHIQYPGTIEDGSPMFFHPTEPFVQYQFYPQYFQQQWMNQFAYPGQQHPPACMREPVDHPQAPSFPSLDYNIRNQFVLPPKSFPPTIKNNDAMVVLHEPSHSPSEHQPQTSTFDNDSIDAAAKSSPECLAQTPFAFPGQLYVKEEFVLPPDPTPTVLERNENNDLHEHSAKLHVNNQFSTNPSAEASVFSKFFETQRTLINVDRKWKKRTFFDKPQTKALESLFLIVQTLHKPERLELAKMIGLSEEQIRVWLQNRRFKRGKVEGVVHIKMGKKEYEDKAKLAIYAALDEFEKMTTSERASNRFNPY